MARVLLMTDRDSPHITGAAAKQDAIVLGFWSSKEAADWISKSCKMDVLRLNEAIRDYPYYVEKAYSLAHFIAEDSPDYRGTRPMIAWEEYLANAVLHSLITVDLHRELIRRYGSGTEVVFLAPSETQKVFCSFNDWKEAPFRIRVLKSGIDADRENGLRRRIREFVNLIQEVRQDRDWARVFWTPLEVLDDRYQIRSTLWPKITEKKTSRWFYGSFANSIRILHRHLPNLDSPNAWVLNRFGARRGLLPEDRWYHLWHFGKPAGAREHREYLRAAADYFSSLPLKSDDLPLQSLLSFSPAFPYFLKRILPLALAEIDLMHAFLEKASPREIWVGNQWGSEGELILVANKMGIPVTQVQHGALHWYFGFSPVYSHRFLVWGSFWRERLKASEQQKVEISNPGLEVAPVGRRSDSGGKKQITIFTSPARAATLWNPQITGREVSFLIKRLLDKGYKVLMRVHPGDQIAFWRRYLVAVIGFLPEEIRFSKEDPLEAVLRETDLAVMFFSTVFLHCLESGIPVIGLGWYPHVWRKPIEQTGMIHFADTVADVLELIDTLSKTPDKPVNVNPFLAR